VYGPVDSASILLTPAEPRVYKRAIWTVYPSPVNNRLYALTGEKSKVFSTLLGDREPRLAAPRPAAYDAVYLSVAQTSELRFVTADDRLIRKIREGQTRFRHMLVALSEIG